jgi:hypothetical protein
LRATADERVLLMSPLHQLWDPFTGRPVGPVLGHIPLTSPWERADRALLFADERWKALTRWRLAPVGGTPEQVTVWVQAVTGQALDEAGDARALSADERAERERRAAEFGGDPLPR